MTTNNNKLLHGPLKDIGLVELLQMMEMQSMTGAIHLKHPAGRIGILYLNEGKLASCSELDSGALTLGDVLQQLGMVTKEQVDFAFSQQLQDALGMRIGERLRGMGVINQKQLRDALRTRALWTARELSLWQEGRYEFIASPDGRTISPYGEESLEIEVMRVTMEIVHYSDEWERLSRFLKQGMRTTFQIIPNLPTPPTPSYALGLDARTVELLGLVNLHRTVRRIATAMRRPELDVASYLAQLVHQRLLFPVFQEISPQPAGDGRSGRGVRLPDPAEKLRMESFEMLNLISRMEQEWNRRRSPMEQLPALVEFVNWTMDALTETCQANGIELDQGTLEYLLDREKLRYMGNYRFIIDQNHIDVENFASLCYEVIMSGDMQKAADFYDEGWKVLQRMLRCIFDSINARVASVNERLENQEVWEAMFTQFALQQHA